MNHGDLTIDHVLLPRGLASMPFGRQLVAVEGSFFVLPTYSWTLEPARVENFNLRTR